MYLFTEGILFFVSPALVFGFSPDQVPLDSIASHSGAKSGDYLVKIGGDCDFTMFGINYYYY